MWLLKIREGFPLSKSEHLNGTQEAQKAIFNTLVVHKKMFLRERYEL